MSAATQMNINRWVISVNSSLLSQITLCKKKKKLEYSSYFEAENFSELNIGVLDSEGNK